MSLIDRAFTHGVNTAQKYVVPVLQRRRPQYPEPGPSFRQKLCELGLIPERFYRGAMVFDPGRAETLITEIETHPPHAVLELGCGNTTAILCALGRKYGFSVTSLENHPDSASYVAYLLEGLPIQAGTNILLCGFARSAYPDGKKYWWYDVDLGKLGKTYDLVFVDGPMRSLVGRNGALPKVWDYMAAGWRVYVDDAASPYGRAMIREWSERFPCLTVERFGRVGCLAKITRQPGLADHARVMD